MWERMEDRLSLLELLASGKLRRRATQSESFHWLSELSWTRATGRRDELTLVPEKRSELVSLLDLVWPSWQIEQVTLLVGAKAGVGLPGEVAPNVLYGSDTGQSRGAIPSLYTKALADAEKYCSP